MEDNKEMTFDEFGAPILVEEKKVKKEPKKVDFDSWETIDLSNKKIFEKYQTKLMSSSSELGLGFVGCKKLFELSNEAGTACWAFNPKTKEERIMMNPNMLNYNY